MTEHRKRRTSNAILPVDMRPAWPAYVVVPVHEDDREAQRAAYLALVEQFEAVVASIDEARGCRGPVEENRLDRRWNERLQLSRMKEFEKVRSVHRLSVDVAGVKFDKGLNKVRVALRVGLPDLVVELKQSSRADVAKALNFLSWRVWQEIDRERRHYLATLRDRKLRTTLDGKGRRKAKREGATAGPELEANQPQSFWGPTERVEVHRTSMTVKTRGQQAPQAVRGGPTAVPVTKEGGKPRPLPREVDDPFDVPVRKHGPAMAAAVREGLQKRGAAREVTVPGRRRVEGPKAPPSKAGKGFDAVVDVHKLRAQKRSRVARSRS